MSDTSPVPASSTAPPGAEPALLALPWDRIGLLLGPLALAAWVLFVDRGGLTPEAHRLAGVMLLTVIWWVTEPIPIPATALAALALCVIIGAVPGDERGHADVARTVLAPLAAPAVFFLMGGLFLGRAMTRHGLDRRIALAILCTRWAGRSPGTVLAAVGLSVCLVSMWISNVAATAMMYPVTLGIIGVLAAGSRLPEAQFARSHYASALLLMTGYASSVGGIATPIGTATNVVAMGFFKRPEYFGRPVDFLRWSLLGVPLMLVLALLLFAWLRLLAPAGHLDLGRLRAYLKETYAGLGPWRRGEVNTLVVFLVLITLWVTPGVLALVATPETQAAFSRHLPEEITALLAPVLLFLAPVDWKQRKFSLESEDFRQIDWGTLLLFGTGLSLGNLMFRTGLAEVVGQGVFDMMGTSNPWLIAAAAIGGSLVLTQFTSNTAVAATLLPVVLPICRQAGIDPLPPLFGLTLAASFGSSLPVSTPPNAIIYSCGTLPLRRMIVAGVGFDLLAGVVIWLVLRLAIGLGWTPLSPV